MSDDREGSGNPRSEEKEEEEKEEKEGEAASSSAVASPPKKRRRGRSGSASSATVESDSEASLALGKKAKVPVTRKGRKSASERTNGLDGAHSVEGTDTETDAEGEKLDDGVRDEEGKKLAAASGDDDDDDEDDSDDEEKELVDKKRSSRKRAASKSPLAEDGDVEEDEKKSGEENDDKDDKANGEIDATKKKKKKKNSTAAAAQGNGNASAKPRSKRRRTGSDASSEVEAEENGQAAAAAATKTTKMYVRVEHAKVSKPQAAGASDAAAGRIELTIPSQQQASDGVGAHPFPPPPQPHTDGVAYSGTRRLVLDEVMRSGNNRLHQGQRHPLVETGNDGAARINLAGRRDASVGGFRNLLRRAGSAFSSSSPPPPLQRGPKRLVFAGTSRAAKTAAELSRADRLRRGRRADGGSGGGSINEVDQFAFEQEDDEEIEGEEAVAVLRNSGGRMCRTCTWLLVLLLAIWSVLSVELYYVPPPWIVVPQRTIALVNFLSRIRIVVDDEPPSVSILSPPSLVTSLLSSPSFRPVATKFLSGGGTHDVTKADENETNVQVESRAQVKSESRVKPKSESEAEAEAKDESEVEVVTKSDCEAETQCEINVAGESEAIVKDEGETESVADSRIVAEIETKGDGKSEAESKSDRNAETQSRLNVDDESKVGIIDESEVISTTVGPSMAVAEIQRGSDVDGGSKAEIQYENEAESATGGENVYAAETKGGSEAETLRKSDVGGESETEAESATEGEDVAAAETMGDSTAEIQSEIDVDGEIDAKIKDETEADSVAVVEAKDDSEGEADDQSKGSVLGDSETNIKGESVDEKVAVVEAKDDIDDETQNESDVDGMSEAESATENQTMVVLEAQDDGKDNAETKSDSDAETQSISYVDGESEEAEEVIFDVGKFVGEEEKPPGEAEKEISAKDEKLELEQEEVADDEWEEEEDEHEVESELEEKEVVGDEWEEDEYEEEEPEQEPEIIIKEVFVDKIIYEDVPNPSLFADQRNIRMSRFLLDRYQYIKSHAESAGAEVAMSMDEHSDVVADISSEVEGATGALDAVDEDLKGWEARLAEAEAALDELGVAWVEGTALEKEAAKIRAKGALDVLIKSGSAPFAASLFDSGDVNIPMESCAGEDYVLLREEPDLSTDLDPFSQRQSSKKREKSAVEWEEDATDPRLSPEDVERSRNDLIRLAESTAMTLRRNPEKLAAVKRWVSEVVEIARERFPPMVPVPDEGTEAHVDASRPPGMTPERFRNLVDQLLEADAADLTGKYDFASLRSGATVSFGGRRRTSPSLADNLPLGNRAMRALRLRFYGHGPEAALSPTHPRDALGQCWSFEDDGALRAATAGTAITRGRRSGEEEDDDVLGNYATLTVNLAARIYVASVAVEHPPPEISPTIGTAIRNFRVFGYEEQNGRGEPWFLGSFRYDINGSRSLQEFAVQPEVEHLPKMRSVTLAVDNNWGADYSCLYRFRVHGQ